MGGNERGQAYVIGYFYGMSFANLSIHLTGVSLRFTLAGDFKR